MASAGPARCQLEVGVLVGPRWGSRRQRSGLKFNRSGNNPAGGLSCGVGPEDGAMMCNQARLVQTALIQEARGLSRFFLLSERHVPGG